MKKLTIILIFIYFTTNLFTQNLSGIADYNVSSNFEFKDLKEKEKKILNKIFKNVKEEKKGKFKLMFNGSESIFFAEKRMKINETKVDLHNINSKIIGKIYSNYKSKLIIQEKQKFGIVFNIEKKIKHNNWIITKESVKIGKYLCYKAYYKQNENKKNKTIAWFTPDIPLNIGPKGYSGLPGFIVMLKEDIFIYSLNKINFSDNVKINIPKKGRKVTQKKYDSIYKVFRARKDKLDREN
ncbi:MAG: GLPGLI family protein [Polaribacter sp.]|jgi:GLPGLI family protein